MSESLLLWSELALLLLLLWSELALLLRPEAAAGSLESLIIVHKQVARPLALRPPWPLTLLASEVTRDPGALSELLPEAVLCGLSAPSLSSLRSSSFSLTLFLLGTGGLTPLGQRTPFSGGGDFKIPLGPLVSSVTLLLLLVSFSLGLSEPLRSFCLERLTFLASCPRPESVISEDSDLATCNW